MLVTSLFLDQRWSVGTPRWTRNVFPSIVGVTTVFKVVSCFVVGLHGSALCEVLVWHVRPIEENNFSPLMVFIVSFVHN